MDDIYYIVDREKEMVIYHEYKKVLNVIRSCKNSDQLNLAMNWAFNVAKKRWKNNRYAMYVCEEIEWKEALMEWGTVDNG